MNARILLGAVAALGLAACSHEAPPTPQQLPRATVRLVQARSEEQGTRVPAVVQPLQSATISTRLPARVERVHVKEGDEVKAGAVLVTLAGGDVRAQLAAARAGLSSAAAHERRIRSLVSQAAATRSELEQAEAQRAQAEAGVRTAEEALRYTELRAPFAGRVQAKRVTAGDLVTPGAPLVELEGRGLELVATLPEAAVGQLKVGQALAFETGEQKGKAELSTIAPSADPVTHRVEVRARVVEAPGLRAGSFARLVLPDGAATAAAGELWVPTSALVQRGDLKGVFVVEEGSAALRWLQLGDPVGDSVPVRAGLAASDEIIDTPGELQDGQPIEVTRAQ